MKHIILIADGMADWPIDSLNGKTPVDYAQTPHLDFITQYGRLARVKTIPDGMNPGSDVATLSIMGYDPMKYYTGRAPLEAASMGLSVPESATIFRCNTVTIQNGIMIDYSAGHIPSHQSKELILALEDNLAKEGMLHFYPGISYRHLAVIQGDYTDLECTPPHDITDKPLLDYLPQGNHQELIRSYISCSEELFKSHPINQIRCQKGELPVTHIWLWGQGKMPQLPDFQAKYRLAGGTIISAVDLVKGIGKSAGLTVPDIPGATGYLDTNYAGKIDRAIKALQSHDFLLIHIEAPDECGHQGRADLKIQAIEDFDAKIIKPILDYAKDNSNCRIMVLPDHPTPCTHKTHVAEPVPVAFIQYPIPRQTINPGLTFTEANAAKSDLYFDKGYLLMDYFLKNNWD